MHPGHGRRVRSSGDTRDIQGKTEMSGTEARARGTAAIVPLSGLLRGSLQTGNDMPVLNPPPTQPILKLHWPDETDPPPPTHKNSRWDCCWEATPTLPLLGADHSMQAHFRGDILWLITEASMSYSNLFSLSWDLAAQHKQQLASL